MAKSYDEDHIALYLRLTNDHECLIYQMFLAIKLYRNVLHA